jgi:hypothetical protein
MGTLFTKYGDSSAARLTAPTSETSAARRIMDMAFFKTLPPFGNTDIDYIVSEP